MATYTLINSVTVGSGGSATMTFSSIPSTYTDLCLKISARADYSGDYIAFRLNPNGSTSNATSRIIYGTGSSTASFTDTIIYANTTAATATSNTFGSSEFYIPNYTSSSFKSISYDGVTENNATSVLTLFSASLWSDTTAISSLTISTTTGNFAQYSTAYLYGISNA